MKSLREIVAEWFPGSGIRSSGDRVVSQSDNTTLRGIDSGIPKAVGSDSVIREYERFCEITRTSNAALEDNPDYWDSPSYDDFWNGAPGLSPPEKNRPRFGHLQVRSPEELEVGKQYLLRTFNGVRESKVVIIVTGKEEKHFSCEAQTPGSEWINGRVSFAWCSILPYESDYYKDGLWEGDNYILRMAE